MSVEHVDFFRLAQQCFDSGRCEMTYRNTISRAYYGLYHLVKSKVSEPIPSYSTGSHRQLSLFLQEARGVVESKKKTYKKLGYILEQQHLMRCASDYRLNQTITQYQAQSALQSYLKVVEICEQLEVVNN
ncbi:hypothetical protein [Vibrio echinoideorum]|uniref:hypothetical protein n=1 Tax=Vibrio echinoideorum TaxID=2100116 RepID=UPI003553A778